MKQIRPFCGCGHGLTDDLVAKQNIARPNSNACIRGDAISEFAKVKEASRFRLINQLVRCGADCESAGGGASA